MFKNLIVYIKINNLMGICNLLILCLGFFIWIGFVVNFLFFKEVIIKIVFDWLSVGGEVFEVILESDWFNLIENRK